MNILFWALVGWCGTGPWWWWPRWWPLPLPLPGPPPPPEPWWFDNRLLWVVKIVGVVFGVIGGWAFDRSFAGTTQIPTGSLAAFITSGGGAFLFARVASDLAGSVLVGRGAPEKIGSAGP